MCDAMPGWSQPSHAIMTKEVPSPPGVGYRLAGE